MPSASAVDVDGAGARSPRPDAFLLDLGTGCRQQGFDLPAGPARIAAAVTHLHFDHVQGLPFYRPALTPGSVIDVYGPPPEGMRLEDAFHGFIKPPWFPVELRNLPGEIRFHEVRDAEFSVGPFSVMVRQIPHVGETCGYRIGEAGASVAYISDHQAPFMRDVVSPAVLALCDGVDLLIHDAQYTEQEFSLKKEWGHSTLGYAVRVARESGARRLALYHHDPTHDDGDLDRMLEEVSKLASGVGAKDLEIVMASEGLTMEIAQRTWSDAPAGPERGSRV
ncbi:MAG TPA: MBL fold metallo-hydrolase [Acidimicrobiales bacterium]|nr:MBL fold metallo-hydrolase [Acidimicrobiales bacterium]